MSVITLTIDDKQVQAEEGTTILEAAKTADIKIPTLCYLKDINPIGACRICVVEVQGERALQASCVTPVQDNMVVYTNSPVVRASRRTTLELILSNHPFVCPSCVRDKNCELQALADYLDISMYYTVYTNPDFPYKGEMSRHAVDDSSSFLIRDPAKCVLCQRCVAVCKTNVLSIQNRGFETVIAPKGGIKLGDSGCVNCGECVQVCPTGALQERDHAN